MTGRDLGAARRSCCGRSVESKTMVTTEALSDTTLSREPFQTSCLLGAFLCQDLESCSLLPSAGLCWLLPRAFPVAVLSMLPLKVNRLSGLMVLAPTRHRQAAEVGREKSCLPGWTEGRCRGLDLLRLMLPRLRGRQRCCPRCRGV